MISTEVLSEVLGVYVRDGWYFDCELLLYTYDKILGLDENYHSEINIHELAHKCKEWAFDKGYIIEVGVHPTIKKDRSDRDYFYKITTDRGQILVSKFDEIIKTEPEAIFKACEWILKEKK